MLLYLMEDRCGLDMEEIVRAKVKRNGEKYLVEKAKDSVKKYDKLYSLLSECK